MTILSTIAWAIGFCFFALALVVFFGIVEKTPLFWHCCALSALGFLAGIGTTSIRERN
jgi:hypothetical protein